MQTQLRQAARGGRGARGRGGKRGALTRAQFSRLSGVPVAASEVAVGAQPVPQPEGAAPPPPLFPGPRSDARSDFWASRKPVDNWSGAGADRADSSVVSSRASPGNRAVVGGLAALAAGGVAEPRRGQKQLLQHGWGGGGSPGDGGEGGGTPPTPRFCGLGNSWPLPRPTPSVSGSRGRPPASACRRRAGRWSGCCEERPRRSGEGAAGRRLPFSAAAAAQEEEEEEEEARAGAVSVGAARGDVTVG